MSESGKEWNAIVHSIGMKKKKILFVLPNEWSGPFLPSILLLIIP